MDEVFAGILVIVVIFGVGFALGNSSGKAALRTDQVQTCEDYGKIVNANQKYDFICVERKK